LLESEIIIKNLNDTVCGVDCTKCGHLHKECYGCEFHEGRVYWTKYIQKDRCPIYFCCACQHNLDHCGKCSDFVCELFREMAFADPNISHSDAQKSLIERTMNLHTRNGK